MEIFKTAGYVRVSTSQQVETGTSIEDQKQKIKHESELRGWGQPTIYDDEGASGKSNQRPALQNLIKDIKLENYHAIFFTKLDRLARNLRDILNFYHEAEKYGVKIICIDNPVISTDGPMGNMMLQVMGAFAQFERDLIRSRTVSGRMIKWRNGQAIMGRLPFGYNFNKLTSTIEIDTKKKEIIEKIFSLYIEKRLSMIDIASNLTDNKIQTPSEFSKRKDASSVWNANSVREILSNESYTGLPKNYNKFKYKWNDKNKLYKTEEKKDENEWISITLPQIIEKLRFEQAQSIIDHNKSKPKKKHKGLENKFIAENVLKCGHCSAKISKQTSGSRNFIYYTCPWRRASEKQLNVKQKKKCYLPFLDSDKVDNAVYNQIVDLISNPKDYAEEWMKENPRFELKIQLDTLNDKYIILEKKLSKAVKIELNANDNDIEKIYKKEREKIENEFHSIKRKLTTAKNELSFHENRIDKINQFQKIFQHDKREYSMRMKSTLKRLLNKLTSEEKKKLINAVISPETGGCVYVRELTAQDLGLPEDKTTTVTLKPVHGNKVGERDFVIELDFTLEPHRIIEIIQSMDGRVFKLGEQ